MRIKNAELFRLHTVRKNVLQMLKSRDYTIKNFSFESLEQLMKKLIAMGGDEGCMDIHAVNHDEEITVHFVVETDLGIKKARDILTSYINSGCNRLIVVHSCPKVSHYARSLMNNEQSLTIELFPFERMTYNPTSFVYAPKHRLMLPAERDAILQKFPQTSLPTILVDDVMARWYGAVAGDVFSITRPHPSGATETVYRIVA